MEHVIRQPANDPLAAGAPDGINVGNTERVLSAVAGITLAALGLKQRTPLGLALAAAGGVLAWRGATGHCGVYERLGLDTAGSDVGVNVQDAVTINRPREEVYAFWRDFENLPRFMEHLVSVQVLDGGRSHWVAKAPLGRTVEWDAEIINEAPGELIAWRSLDGSDITSAGSVNFERATGGRGTVVRVSLQYLPPMGAAGAAIAKLFGEEPDVQIQSDLRHLRQLLEAGEIPTTMGQPAGPSLKRRLESHVVESAKSSTMGEPARSGLEEVEDKAA